MFRSPKAGLHFFSAGVAWEDAFRQAAIFLKENQGGLVLLGPGIGESAKYWLQEELLQEQPLRLGPSLLEWSEWVKSRARASALASGECFRELNLSAGRALFRQTLNFLEQRGSLVHLGPLWKKDRFFDSFLECIQEARLAGLLNQEAVLRARELLQAGSDPVTRDSYDDFWKVLLLFEELLLQEPGLYDRAAMVRKATSATGEEVCLFLLGFDQLSLLEVDLVHALGRETAVFLPLALSSEQIYAHTKAKASSPETAPASFLQALLTNFPGHVQLHNFSSSQDPVPPAHFLLASHAPSEEARSAAAFGRFTLGQGWDSVRYVLSPNFLEDESVATAFHEELGLPRRFHDRRALAQPIGRLFFHALQLKERSYELNFGLEFAQLLHFTLNRFQKIPALATAAGVRLGLQDWREKADDSQNKEFGEFVSMLEAVDKLLPSSGLPAQFADAVDHFAELVGIGELARRACDSEIEREAHATLSALVRNAQLLSVAVREEISFAEWIREWKALLDRSSAGESPQFFPRIQFYRYGEWLPPSTQKTATVLLGFQRGVEPSRSFNFYLEEGARRKLADLLLPTQAEADLTFLDQIRRMAASSGSTLFSWSHLDSTGKEQQPSWLVSALSLVTDKWPEVARITEARPFIASPTARISQPKVESYSASLLEAYAECPFKAFVLKVLHLEDKMQAASLDLGHLDTGSIVHKALELYYGKGHGKSIIDPLERELLLRDCLTQAVAAQKVEYFKGGSELLKMQVKRLERMLLKFLETDAANYQAFPFFGEPLVEQRVEGKLGGRYQWTGKIDRIDLDEANRRFLVLDYKTGASTPVSGELQKLRRFQLPMYLDAMEELRPGWSSIGGLYVSLRTGERKQGLVRKEFNRTAKSQPNDVAYFQFHPRTGALSSEAEFQELRERIRAEAIRLAEEVEKGVFDVAPFEDESCKRCEARAACRIRELRAPLRQQWFRQEASADFDRFLKASLKVAEGSSGSDKGFNEEQADALSRRGAMVFIEASAGTGKTTVIVERIRRFLLARIEAGDLPHRAVEKFSAISFTDKSAQELAARVSASLLKESSLGPRAAAQALQQISTIHGFCRRILSDFPTEAGVSPMAELLDERGAEMLRENAFDEFFLHTPEEAKPSLEVLFEHFPRAKIETLLRELLEQRNLLSGDLALYEAWLSGASDAPGSLIPAGEEREALRHLLRTSEAFCSMYERMKRDRDQLDFNDLESLALKVLEQEHACTFYRERFELILVDEFQDTNSVQREILERLAQPGWKNVFVVGDAKQSIYRFRAADVSVFQGLRKLAETRGELVTLFRNYRSREELVEAANAVTRSVFPAAGDPAPEFEAVAAEAKAGRKSGGLATIVEYGDPNQKLSADQRRETESEILVNLIREQLAKGRSPGSIAVLLRKLSSNDAFLRALTAAGIPFRVGSSRGFYAQQVILDAIALLRALCGASNDMALLALLRSPWARLSDTAILAIQSRGAYRESLWDLLRESDAPLLFELRNLSSFLSASELLSRAFRFYPLDRREHLQVTKLLAILAKLEGEQRPKTEIIDRVSLWAGWEREEDALDDSTMPEPGAGEGSTDSGAVQVMTIHASKGLEFDVTILPGLVSGLLPDRSALRVVPGVGIALKLEDQEDPQAWKNVGERDKERDLAESKRLLYVAITRAKEECLFVLPRENAEGKKKGKGESWAEMLRASSLSSMAKIRSGESIQLAPLSLASVDLELQEKVTSTAPIQERRLEASITELAAYQYCPEFHRRKFVQQWDDRVVSLWPVDPKYFRRARATKGEDQGKDHVARLLSALKIENKERGIALHRVLERLKSPELDPEVGRLWLREAYGAQGADVESSPYQMLANHDIELLQKFLFSPLGQEIFSTEVEAFPELPFFWKFQGAYLQGAMDRVIRKPDGSWVVVDYKSSLLEESLKKYLFQVQSYMAAVAEYARGRDGGNPHVTGYLVDLYRCSSLEVGDDSQQASENLSRRVKEIRESYTLAEDRNRLFQNGLQGADHCLSCTYRFHCEIGKEIVLRFP